MSVTDEQKALVALEGMYTPDLAVRCRQCRYSRKVGNAPVSAKTLCASHGVRNLHTCDVKDHGVVVHTYSPTIAMQTFDDVPPF